MEPSNLEPSGTQDIRLPDTTPTDEDRSVWLLLFGIVEIVGGVFSALAIPVMVLGVLRGPNAASAGSSVASIAPVLLTCCLSAIMLIVLGFGAVRARRWAWALNLVLSWIWLVTGILAGASYLTGLPGGRMHGTGSSINSWSLAVLVVVPIAFVVFFGRRDVEMTCRRRDPVERWTDRTPLPLLAFALLAAWSGANDVLSSFLPHPLGFFGHFLTGWPAILLFLVFAAAEIFAAFAFLRAEIAGWWVAFIAFSVRTAGLMLTIGRADLPSAYKRLNFDLDAKQFLWRGVGTLVPYVVLLLWLKRYFRRNPRKSGQ